MPSSVVGVITRSISVAADASVLWFTLAVTWGFLKEDSEARAQSALTSLLLKNGKSLFLL